MSIKRWGRARRAVSFRVVCIIVTSGGGVGGTVAEDAEIGRRGRQGGDGGQQSEVGDLKGTGRKGNPGLRVLSENAAHVCLQSGQHSEEAENGARRRAWGRGAGSRGCRAAVWGTVCRPSVD